MNLLKTCCYLILFKNFVVSALRKLNLSRILINGRQQNESGIYNKLQIFFAQPMRNRLLKKQQIKNEEIINRRYSEKLKQLNLSCETHYWKEILKYRNWEQLKSLELSSNKITDSDITIITSLKWPSLQQLTINWNSIKDINGIWEAQCPNLTQISFDGNKITGEGLQKLISAPLTKQLKQLHMGQNQIGSKGAKLLIKADLPVFEVFSAWGCQIGNEGVAHLAKAQWPSLKKCIINRNNVGCDGMSALTNFNMLSITKMVIIFEINIWEAVHILVTNFPVNTQTGRFHHSNQSINRDIIEILNRKLSVYQFKR